jgi:hypothetical protein
VQLNLLNYGDTLLCTHIPVAPYCRRQIRADAAAPAVVLYVLALALLLSVIVIAAIPWISTGFL